MKRSKILFALCIFVYCSPINTEAGQLFESQEYAFSIEFPDNWQMGKGASGSSLAKAVLRDENGRIAMSFVSVSPLDSQEYLDLLSCDPKKMAMRVLQKYGTIPQKFISAERVEIDHNTAIKVDLVLLIPNQERLTSTYYIPRKGHLLVIGVGADSPLYKEMKPIFDTIISSIDFKGATQWKEVTVVQQKNVKQESGGRYMLTRLFQLFCVFLVTSAFFGLGRMALDKKREFKQKVVPFLGAILCLTLFLYLWFGLSWGY